MLGVISAHLTGCIHRSVQCPSNSYQMTMYHQCSSQWPCCFCSLSANFFIAKVVLKIVSDDVQAAAGSLQTCDELGTEKGASTCIWLTALLLQEQGFPSQQARISGCVMSSVWMATE